MSFYKDPDFDKHPVVIALNLVQLSFFQFSLVFNSCLEFFSATMQNSAAASRILLHRAWEMDVAWH